ncbi:MAG: hypothetical protein IJC46_04990 [Clostridia bacterium]|nr:hypothetical protein [Clostridia bacterium]
MLMKLMGYLLVVAVVCAIIGGMTDIATFSTLGTGAFCGAGVVFLVWSFCKIFFKDE